jgi:hypothetical protein
MIGLLSRAALVCIAALSLVIFALKSVSAFADDNWIAYLDEQDAFTDINIIDVDRGTTHNLSKTPFVSENQPSWSDSNELTHAFLVLDGVTLRRCAISLLSLDQVCRDTPLPEVNLAESEPGLVDFLASNQEMILAMQPSPDESKWAYVTSNSLYEPITIGVVYRDGGGIAFPFVGSVYELSWSPDGNLLAIATRDRFEGDIEIMIVNAVTGGFQQITQNAALDQAPTWSPDGQQIAFISDRDDAYSRTSLYVMNIDGSNVRRLTQNDYRITAPAWKP